MNEAAITLIMLGCLLSPAVVFGVLALAALVAWLRARSDVARLTAEVQTLNEQVVQYQRQLGLPGDQEDPSQSISSTPC
ncbi:MAG: hypothetical protein KC487_15650 [Anaerolineae bacterium]|nr:hypothetical protein [Anaerolineae bacterium]